jgi:hypothetical protein
MMPLTMLVRCPAIRAVMDEYTCVLSKVAAKAWLVLRAVVSRACAIAAPFTFNLRKEGVRAQRIMIDCLRVGTRLEPGGALYVAGPEVAFVWETDFAPQGWGPVDLPQGMVGLLAYQAVVMHTNLGNHCTMHFRRHVRRATAAWLREQLFRHSAAALDAVVDALLLGPGLPGNGRLETSAAIAGAGWVQGAVARVRAWVNGERAHLGLANAEPWTMKWAEQNQELIIRFYDHILAVRDVRHAAPHGAPRASTTSGVARLPSTAPPCTHFHARCASSTRAGCSGMSAAL